MLAGPILIDRSTTNYCTGVSGKGKRIKPRWRPNKQRNGHLSPRSGTNIYHLLASFPAPLVSHWSLHLRSFNFPCEDQKKKFTKVFFKTLFTQ
jgi:hypothetical protein